MKKILSTDKAPKPVGSYSPVVSFGDLLFISGQVPMDPSTGALLPGDLETETRRVLENVKTILEDVGSSMDHVLKVTAYLQDMDDFAAFNKIYAEYFTVDPPARTCIQAGRLPFDIKVEIDVIAARKG